MIPFNKFEAGNLVRTINQLPQTDKDLVIVEWKTDFKKWLTDTFIFTPEEEACMNTYPAKWYSIAGKSYAIGLEVGEFQMKWTEDTIGDVNTSPTSIAKCKDVSAKIAAKVDDVGKVVAEFSLTFTFECPE